MIIIGTMVGLNGLAVLGCSWVVHGLFMVVRNAWKNSWMRPRGSVLCSEVRGLTTCSVYSVHHHLESVKETFQLKVVKVLMESSMASQQSSAVGMTGGKANLQCTSTPGVVIAGV